MTQAPVVRAVTVQTQADRAFAIFTERIGQWWPLATHSPAESLSADLAFEDGKLVESGAGGSSVWGTVTEWDPPARLEFTWSPSGGPVTSIGVDFEESDGQTRVVLTHEGWQAYGDRAPEIRASYAGKLAWGWVLQLFAYTADVPSRTPDSGATELGVPTGGPAYGIEPLRSGYEAVAVALAVATAMRATTPFRRRVQRCRLVTRKGPMRGVAMRAAVGDRLHVHGRVVGTPDQTSEIIEIRGRDGAPPYLVRRYDGHEALVFPGTDASVEHPENHERT